MYIQEKSTDQIYKLLEVVNRNNELYMRLQDEQGHGFKRRLKSIKQLNEEWRDPKFTIPEFYEIEQSWNDLMQKWDNLKQKYGLEEAARRTCEEDS